MGLFKKRPADTAELDQLRAEITSMAARLDAADADKAQVDHRIHTIATRLDQTPPPAPPPPPPAVDQADVDIMRARIQRLYDRLDEYIATPPPPPPPGVDPLAVASLAARVDQLAAELAAALVDDGDPSTPPTIDPDEFAALAARVHALGTRLDTTPPPPPPAPAPTALPVDPDEFEFLRERIQHLHERITAVDLRITSISTELANQVTELAGEVDTIGAREPAPAPAAGDDGAAAEVAEVVDELRDAQTRLANEQARYQIVFRQELADLAERLRRS